MYIPDVHSVRNGNVFTLTLATPVPEVIQGSMDYEEMINKPSINGVVLSGDLTLEDLGIPDFSDVPNDALTDEELEAIFEEAMAGIGIPDLSNIPQEALSDEDLDNLLNI